MILPQAHTHSIKQIHPYRVVKGAVEHMTAAKTGPISWIGASLGRKLLVTLAAILMFASVIFLAVFVGLYRAQLSKERASASMQVNRLLQASLENAMLKRDLPGLRQIVTRLGKQKDIEKVVIINPKREVRFSSDPALLHQVLPLAELVGCSNCGKDLLGIGEDFTLFTANAAGASLLRSVNPIHNKKPCTVCHGALAVHPVNGILIVDYVAGGVRRQALIGAATMTAAGGLVVLMALAAAWWFLKRQVVDPVEKLAEASRALAEGKLETQVSLNGGDELAQLGASFNAMSRRLGQTLSTLSSQEAYLQSLVDAVPDGIRVIDQDYRVQLANKAYCRQHGLDMSRVVGGHCFEHSHNRQAPCPGTLITCPLQVVTASGEPVKVLHHHIRADGSQFHAEVVAAPLNVVREGSQNSYVVESIRDLERQISITQEQRLAELGQLATGVAHEIHNPLASVRLGLQALLRKAESPSLNAEIKDYLTQIDGEIDKCIEVTKRLLNLSVPPSHNIQLVSVDDIIPDVLSLLRFEAEKLNVDLHFDLASDLRVLGTDAEMRMLILNIAQNAFHAMPDGGELMVKGWSGDGRVNMSFTDTGIGISEDVLDHIFDPFFSRRADSDEGTGLGLTICKAIVDRHDGRIEVDSSPGNGTTFTISFPSADEG